MRALRFLLVPALLLSSAGCDYTGDWLFAGKVDGLPGIDHLGNIEPFDVNDAVDVENGVIMGEIGPTGTADRGGVTFTFDGTGDHVCVWVDPELVYWNQSVSKRQPVPKWSWPDNVFDDGDLDLEVGFAAYYNGTAASEEDGGQIGDFRIRYEDALDQEITVGLNECVIPSQLDDSGGHSGRGSPEKCTIFNTQPGVRYVVVMETWSTPLDDDRLGYGVLLTNGDCRQLVNTVPTGNDECMIMGEAIDPSTGSAYAFSEGFEEQFCNPLASMADYCANEYGRIESGDLDCGEERCFCGDPETSPTDL